MESALNNSPAGELQSSLSLLYSLIVVALEAEEPVGVSVYSKPMSQSSGGVDGPFIVLSQILFLHQSGALS